MDNPSIYVVIAIWVAVSAGLAYYATTRVEALANGFWPLCFCLPCLRMRF